MTADARSVALAYQAAFAGKDLPKAISHLHGIGLFRGPLNSFDAAEAFAKEMSVFMDILKDVRIKKVLANDTDVCILWDYETIVPSIPVTEIAQWFQIEDGKIREMRVIFNPVPFIAAKEQGHLAAALKSVRG